MKQMEEWGEECKITPASRRRQGTRWERPKGGREEEGGGEEETMCADKRRRDRWGGESETGRNRQYFTWCWCQYSANKTLISYMRHKGLHSAFTHLLIQYHICFDMITANKQDRHYTVWSPRQSFMLQFTRHVMVLLKQTVRRLVLLGSCYKAALCSFLVNKLHTKIWIVCTQTKSCFVSEQVNYVEVVFFDHSCRLLALRGTQPWTHRSSGCPMIFSRSNNQWI